MPLDRRCLRTTLQQNRLAFSAEDAQRSSNQADLNSVSVSVRSISGELLLKTGLRPCDTVGKLLELLREVRPGELFCLVPASDSSSMALADAPGMLDVARSVAELGLSSECELIAVRGAGMHAIPEFGAKLLSHDASKRLEAVRMARRLLSNMAPVPVSQMSPVIEEVLCSGAVPHFVQMLSDHGQPDLQFEACWVLTNLMVGDSKQTRKVTQFGAVPLLVDLLHCTGEANIREQAIWALGNIAGDSAPLRDLVLQHNGMAPTLVALCEFQTEDAPLSLARAAAWSLMNCCRSEPPPAFELVASALPTVSALLRCDEAEVLQDACWTIGYILRSSSQHGGIALLDSSTRQLLITLLDSANRHVQGAILRAVGAASVSTDDDTQQFLRDALPAIGRALDHTRAAIRSCACAVVAKVLDSDPSRMEWLGDVEQFLPRLQLALARNAGDEAKTKLRASLRSALSLASAEQVTISSCCITKVVNLLEAVDFESNRISLPKASSDDGLVLIPAPVVSACGC